MNKRQKKHIINRIDMIFLLVTCIVCVFVLQGFINKINSKKITYNILMNDADGLVKGSPVLLSGTHVGLVKKIEIKDNQVNVIFDIFKKHTTSLPECSNISIKTYGIAGSRSLNLYPCKESEKLSGKQFVTLENIRIISFYHVQQIIAKQIVNAENSFSSMISNKQLTRIKNMIYHETITNGILKSINELIEEENKLFNNIEKQNKNIKKTITKLRNFNRKHPTSNKNAK